MRLGFAIAAHIEADVLLLDEVFAVGDEEFQRKCFGKIFEFKQRGGTIVFVSHDASAVERLCERAVLLREGRVEFDGPTHEAIVALPPAARRRARPGRARGRAERVGERRGADRATARAARPRGRAARRSSSPGEPFAVAAARRRRARDRAAAARRASCATTPACSSPAAPHDTAELGWSDGPRRAARSASRSTGLPLADGRFHLRFGLTDARGEHLYHSLDDALAFVVYPAGDERGLCGSKDAGRWRTSRRRRRTARLDELANLPRLADLMEIAPELQFKHYTVAEAQLPADALVQLHGRDARRRRDLLRPRAPRLLRRAHRPEVAEALRERTGTSSASGRRAGRAPAARSAEPCASSCSLGTRSRS